MVLAFQKGTAMDLLLNPNIVYLLLVVGSITLLMAFVTPGTGLLEVGAIFLLMIAGYAIYHLGFNLWSLIILVLALVPFIYAIQKPRREWALALSIVCLVVGSLYLFPGEGWLPAVDPILAIVVSLLAAGFLWLVIRKAVAIIHTRPMQDLKSLVGQVGQAKTEVFENGSVQVASELWSARSTKPIPLGSQVRVVSRDGFTLVVESDEQSKKK
jgi:membrane-bound serine protease (ClpP class)